MKLTKKMKRARTPGEWEAIVTNATQAKKTPNIERAAKVAPKPKS